MNPIVDPNSQQARRQVAVERHLATNRATFTVAAGALAALVAVACERPMGETKAERSSPRAAALAETGKPAPTEDKLGLAAIARRAMPAVVSVASTRAVKASQMPALPFDDPFLRRFFGERHPHVEEQP